MTLSARTTSARALLALVVAALALAGCGGSSDSSSSTAATSAATGGEGEGSGVPAAKDATGAGSGGSSGRSSAGGPSSPGGPSSGSEQPSSGDKHGPPIAQPTGAPAPKITPQQRREASVANISLQTSSSPPSAGGPQVLPAEFTCDGKNTSPALQWHGVPEGTAELALFAVNLRPVNGALFFDWAVARLSPDLEEIPAGKLPRGAVVGRNSFGKTGYGICPEGEEETYIFTLFALPEKLSPSQGFEPLAFRKAVGGTSGNVGLLALSYARG